MVSDPLPPRLPVYVQLFPLTVSATPLPSALVRSTLPAPLNPARVAAVSPLANPRLLSTRLLTVLWLSALALATRTWPCWMIVAPLYVFAPLSTSV